MHPLALVLAAAAGAAAWFAWLAWDTTYQIDPASGQASGPYEAWQVVGCGITVVAVAVLTGLTLPHPWLSALVVTVAFTVAWSITASRDDLSGLWLVGAMLVFVGVGTVSTVLCYAGALTRRVIRPRRPAGLIPATP
jgi:peptidoglycan/LPS O-acetylase OafA/YrhL